MSEIRAHHRDCEDGWYSCPLAEDGCSNPDVGKDVCDCGADAINNELAALRAAGNALRSFARHYDWCDYSRHAGYQYGDDFEALEREHPCDCGAVGAFDAAEKLFPYTPERTVEVLAWRANQKRLQEAAARLRGLEK